MYNSRKILVKCSNFKQNSKIKGKILRSCVYFGIALSISLFIAGFLSGDLSRSSSNAAIWFSEHRAIPKNIIENLDLTGKIVN